MTKVFSGLKRFDWTLIGAVAALCAVGLLTLYSANFGKPTFSFFERQVFFIFLGFFVMFAISYFDFSVFRNFPYLLLIVYSLGLIALLTLLFVGRTIKGASSWFSIGGLGFEPSELM
jgi:cell division protein FtsW (lipid II flippase)